MVLNEFFGKPMDPVKDILKSRDDRQINDDLFWYIVDHDKLHKDFFHPLAKKIKKANKDNHVDKEEIIDAFMPMVNKGCKEYYHSKKMKGKLGKIFSEDLRQSTCERLYDHYKEDIIKGKYKLGESTISTKVSGLNEFAPDPSNDDNGDVPPDIYKLANRWWNASDDEDQDRISMTLRSMGWDIRQSDGENDVCQLTYRDGTVHYLNDSEFDPELYETVTKNTPPINEAIENIFKALIDKIITNETVSYNKRK